MCKGRCQAFYKAGAQHQLVAYQLCFRGCFFKRGNEIVRYAHGFSLRSLFVSFRTANLAILPEKPASKLAGALIFTEPGGRKSTPHTLSLIALRLSIWDKIWKNLSIRIKRVNRMIDRNGYRSNVGIILLNSKNEVFWGKRIKQDSWQFPQGGIKGGRKPGTGNVSGTDGRGRLASLPCPDNRPHAGLAALRSSRSVDKTGLAGKL